MAWISHATRRGVKMMLPLSLVFGMAYELLAIRGGLCKLTYCEIHIEVECNNLR
jgi:hypothetical protein